MYHFNTNMITSAPLDLTPYLPPPVDARVGPPLSMGAVLMILATTAVDYLPFNALTQLRNVKPEDWYLGQTIETLLAFLEHRDPNLPVDVGRSIYYLLSPQFRAMGVQRAEDVIYTIPDLWFHVTRGDSGVWRTWITGANQAVLEFVQPYNCRFEEGAIHGVLEAFDAQHVHSQHTRCMRRGHACCRLEVHWS